jgi:hypothetical protein
MDIPVVNFGKSIASGRRGNLSSHPAAIHLAARHARPLPHINLDKVLQFLIA